MKTAYTTLIVLAVLLIAASASVASAGEGRRACADDVQRLCADAQTKKARKACLVENAEQLSDQCAAKFQRKEERRKAFEAVCGADKQALCSEAEGKHEVGRCMNDHSDELSAPCQAFVAEKRARHEKKGKGKRHHKMKAKRAEFEAACGADREAYCSEVTGEGRKRFKALMVCMSENEEKLAGECRAKVEDARAKMEERDLRKAEIKQACGADVQSLCGEGEGKGRHVRRCLKENREQLSEQCSSTLERFRAERHERRGE